MLTTANQEFMAYIPLYEPGTLGYDVWQEQDHPTRFAHIIIIGNQAAYEWHSALAVVKQIAETPFPKCLVPVEFIGYRPSVNQSTLE
jgi:quinol monooxygenase YgiN